MKNRILKTSLITTILIISLTFNIFLVQAEAGGTGKFLQIYFDGEGVDNSKCNVTATKVGSDQTFLFEASTPEPNKQKVGAGTVILEAYPDIDSGWIFQHFLIGNEEFENGTEYKTEKLDVVTAVFETVTFDIVVSIPDGLGEIWFGDDLVAWRYPEAEYNPATVPVNYGSTPTFVFVPLNDPDMYHVSTVLIDETRYVDLVLTEFTQSYQFSSITEDGHSLAVTFSLDGQAYIPAGSDITVFLSSSASLKFLTTVNEGFAAGNTVTSVVEGDIIVWNITVNTNYVDVVIALIYPEDLPPTTILTCKDPNFELFLKSDLNNDGIINGQDVKIIANVVKHEKFIPDKDDPLYAVLDVNDDTYINEEDVHAVNSLNGVEISDFLWEPLDNIVVDPINHIIYGTADHFSIFRCR